MISFCLIVKNEQGWISKCLESLLPLASEVILADTGSTDNTLPIAQNFPKVRSFEIPWENHFGNARNQTIQKACEPWIFSFDADERIARKDIENFRKLIELTDRDLNIEAISIVRRDYVLNPSVSGFKPCVGEYPEEEMNYPGYYEERMTRIFRNAPHIRWSGSLHEMIDGSLRGQTLKSSLVFHHYGYLPEELERKKKRALYEREGQRKISQNPNDWKAQFDLGIEYLSSQDYADSLPHFEKALQLSGPVEVIASNWGYALMSLKKYDDAVRILNRCLSAHPEHHDSLLNLGTTFMRQSKWKDAIACFEKLLSSHPQSFLALRNRGLCHSHETRFQEAESDFKNALELFPGFIEARLDLASLKVATQDYSSAKTLTLQVLSANPKHPRGNQIIKFLHSASAGPEGYKRS